MADLLGEGAGLLIGVDLKKDVAILESAYNDSQGVTKEFNLNLLRRINRELEADFDLDLFEHHAFYNRDHGRIEMHLVYRRDHAVSVAGNEISFEKDETILTECCYKYEPEEFQALAGQEGFRLKKAWMDDHGYFSVQYLTIPHS